MSNDYITRAYNRFVFNNTESTVTKLSKEKRLANEINYYRSIPDDVAKFFPRVYSSGYQPETQEYFLELELYGYNNLGDYFLRKGITVDFAEIAQHLGHVLTSLQEHKLDDPDFLDDLKKMYEVKTETEYQRLIDNFDDIKKIASHPTLVINEKEYDNFETVWSNLKPFFPEVLYKDAQPTIIHGDFCFSNILVGFSKSNTPILRFIDPRGEFGKHKIYGDFYYDLAKLAHSTEGGYEFIINNRFDLIQSDDLRTFNYSLINYDENIHKLFDEVLYSKYDRLKIKLLQGAIFVSMVARHYDNNNRQIAMYLTGIKLLNEVYLEICPQ